MVKYSLTSFQIKSPAIGVNLRKDSLLIVKTLSQSIGTSAFSLRDPFSFKESTTDGLYTVI